MEYTEFRFKNFKGIGQMTLDLTGNVTTLIGLNESGKTTILEAIFCFSYGAENLDVLDPSMASLREPERWIPIGLRANFNDTIEIIATVRLSDEDRQRYRRHMRKEVGLYVTALPSEIEITEAYAFENSRYSRDDTKRTWDLKVSGTKGQQRNPRDYRASTSEWQAAVAYFKDELPRIWYFPNFLFELPEQFRLDATDEAETTEEDDKSRFYRSTFERILGQLGHGANLDTHVVDRVKSADRADQRNLRSMLLEMGRDITRTVFDGWNRIFGRAPTAQEVELEAAQGDDGQAYLEMKIKGLDGYYDLSERSLGFRWFFMFLLLTSYRDIGPGRSVVFLLDEPASNLHSSAQAELLKSFEKLAERCTLVYTTHSHHMINIKWLDAAYVVKNEALADFGMDQYLSTNTAARTAISATPYRRFVAENPTGTSYFQPVLDILDYRPSDLEPVPEVVLVEGKSDFYILRYAMDVLGVRPSLKLVPGIGASGLDTVIKLHIGWGKSFVILLDGDAEGIKQKARYETAFGSILNDRCITLPTLVGDQRVKEIENVIDIADRRRIVDAIFPAKVNRPRGKKALLQATMELYARHQAVSIQPASTERLTHVAERLQQALQNQ